MEAVACVLFQNATGGRAESSSSPQEFIPHGHLGGQVNLKEQAGEKKRRVAGFTQTGTFRRGFLHRAFQEQPPVARTGVAASVGMILSDPSVLG